VGTIEPNPDNKAAYDELYGIYRHLHTATVDLQHQLAALQQR
jgi:sugar (pentulose or hexulose) kinase